MSQGGLEDGIPGYEYWPAMTVGGVNQQVAAGIGSAQSSAFGANTDLIEVFATTNCFLNFGTNPTAAADTTSKFQPAGIMTYYSVPKGQSWKVAAIRQSVTGTVYITEGA